MLNSWGYAVKQAFIQVLRNRAMSVASMFSITAMLLILGLFFILVVNVNMVSETAKKQLDTIQVYLLDTTTYEEASAMLSQLQRTEGVKEARYLSDQEAMAQWRMKWGDNAYLLDGLENNPLPNSLVIKVTMLKRRMMWSPRSKPSRGSRISNTIRTRWTS